jgi:hypothetical protein
MIFNEAHLARMRARTACRLRDRVNDSRGATCAAVVARSNA